MEDRAVSAGAQEAAAGGAPRAATRALSLRTRALLATAVAALLVGTTMSLLSASRQQNSARWVDHTHQVLESLDALALALREAETAQRGYLLTRDARYQDLFQEALDGHAQRLAALERLVADNPAQQARARALGADYRRRTARLGEVLSRATAGRQAEALALLTSPDTRRMAEAAVRGVREMRGEELRLLSERASRRDRLARVTTAVVVGSSSVLLALFGLAAAAFVSDARRRAAAAAERERLLETLDGQASQLRALAAELEERVRERTAALTAANAELESFGYSVSHDLRAPLRAIDGFTQAVARDPGNQLTEHSRALFGRVRAAAGRMGQLIDDLLQLSRLSRSPLACEPVDLSALAREVLDELRAREPQRQGVLVRVEDGLSAHADPRLVRILLENLLGNAWKFTSRRPEAHIEVTGSAPGAGPRVFSVRDDGAGFDMAYAQRLFNPFQRLHSDADFPGTGVGLATVQRVVTRHGGRIWAESAPGQGATFSFTLEAAP